MLTIACYFWVTNIFDDFPIFRICYFDVSKNAKVKFGHLTSNDLGVSIIYLVGVGILTIFWQSCFKR